VCQRGPLPHQDSPLEHMSAIRQQYTEIVLDISNKNTVFVCLLDERPGLCVRKRIYCRLEVIHALLQGRVRIVIANVCS
jgi:hypothetical protein